MSITSSNHRNWATALYHCIIVNHRTGQGDHLIQSHDTGKYNIIQYTANWLPVIWGNHFSPITVKADGDFDIIDHHNMEDITSSNHSESGSLSHHPKSQNWFDLDARSFNHSKVGAVITGHPDTSKNHGQSIWLHVQSFITGSDHIIQGIRTWT